jgi:hypothetical protein
VSISYRTNPNEKISEARIYGLPFGLLGRHVGGGAQDGAGIGQTHDGGLVRRGPPAQ